MMNKFRVKIIFLLLCFLLANLLLMPDYLQAESELEEFESEISEEEEESEEENDKDEKDDDKEEYEENDDNFWVAEIFIEAMIRDPWVYRGLWDITTSPLQLPYYLVEGREDTELASDNRRFQPDNNFMMGVSGQYISANTSGLRANIVGKFDRMAVELGHTAYLEEGSNGNYDLHFSEFLLTYSFARNKYWNFRTGVGVELMAGSEDNTGLKFIYGVDLTDEIVNFNLDLGLSFFADSLMTEFYPKLRYNFDRIEFEFAYRRLSTAGPTLSGPELGVNIYF